MQMREGTHQRRGIGSDQTTSSIYESPGDQGLQSLLSMLIPGLGQIYNGQRRKALMLWGGGLLANVLLIFLKIESTYFGLIALLVAELLFYVLVCVDAFVCARRLRTTTRLFKPSRWYALRGGFVALVYVASALPMAFVIRRYFFQTYKIPSGAMEPTLLIGDHIVVDKRPRQARRGDVVVFVFPPDRSKDFVKRVIAVGGDTVAVKNGIVYLNGQLIAEPYAHFEVLPQDRSPVSPRDVSIRLPCLPASCLSWATIATAATTADSGAL